ncbi:MAG: cupredoxin domain-containing protein [Roseiarcus sp.]
MKPVPTARMALLVAAAALLSGAVPAAQAQDATPVHVALKDHRFVPAELSAPANKPIVIEVANEDGTPAEFESKSLRVEKVVAGGAKITVQIRALAPGRYRFFDDYHEDTTEGFLVVR